MIQQQWHLDNNIENNIEDNIEKSVNFFPLYFFFYNPPRDITTIIAAEIGYGFKGTGEKEVTSIQCIIRVDFN